MKVIKFDPRNDFAADILGESGCANCGGRLILDEGHPWHFSSKKCNIPQARKKQTIRPKPIAVGEKVALWEIWRGMRKGLYCPDTIEVEPLKEGGACALCGKTLIRYPRHLLNATIKECVPIEMRFYPEDNIGTEDETGNLLAIRTEGNVGNPDDNRFDLGLPDSAVADDFVKADTPSWTNKQFVDFFRKTYDLSRWKEMYIWKW